MARILFSQYRFPRFLPFVFILLVIAACRAPVDFKIAVIVDTTTDPVSREDVEAVLAIATPVFNDLSGFSLETIGIVEDDAGGSIECLATDYMEQVPKIPNGILIFSVGDGIIGCSQQPLWHGSLQTGNGLGARPFR